MKPTLDGPLNFLYRRPSEPTAVRFTLTLDAIEQMNVAWATENGGYGDREVGGWLIAHKRAPDQIFAAINSTVVARKQSVLLRNLHDVDEGLPEHLLIVGSWHSHSAGSEGVPSKVDMASSLSHLAHLIAYRGRDRTLDVIGVPRPDGTLSVHGWCTRLRAGIAYRAKTEPASIEVVGW